MGKGDKKTRRGKIVNKSFGVRRLKSKRKGSLADKHRRSSICGICFAKGIAIN